METENINTVLDGYQLLKEVGSGSCGRVFQVKNILSGEIFALKIFPEQGSLAERELQAVRLYQKIEHPNLIRIHHVGKTGDKLFYTMDWCENSLAERKISPEELLSMAKKLTGALAALHKNGLIHRDIKPDNIFFRNGEIVLGDIGLVTQQANATFAGSPGFLAPSLLNGKTIPNEYTDCYALAKTFYCGLSGQGPEKFPYYDGTLSPAASLLMRAILAVCSDKPEIQDANGLLRFLNEPTSPCRQRKFKLCAWLSAAILISLLTALGFFIRSRSHQQNIPSAHKTIPTGKSEKQLPASSPSRPEKATGSPKINPKVQREIQKRPPVRTGKPTVRRENGEISVRRAWNEQNRLFIPQCKDPVQRAEKEFEIEWNDLRIDLLERSDDRKITDQEFYREDRILVSLWKTAKWLIKSGIGAESIDLDHGELKEKLTIRDIDLHQQWVQADLDWQRHKQDCIKELVRKTKESGQDPKTILREMAKQDPALLFFGIEQAEYLGEYEKVRFSGQLNAKQEADEAAAKYMQAREKFLKTRQSAGHPVK